MRNIITQIFEIENKIKPEDVPQFKRNFDRIYHELEQEGYTIVNPLGQTYDERDVSIEANIADDSLKNLKITKVLKPAIYHNEGNGENILIQKAVVIVE